MTKRQEHLPDRHVRTLARRAVTTALVVAALAVTGATAGAAPAQAAVPVAAQTWSSYMYRSLTVVATAYQLRQTLAVQQTNQRTQTNALAAARAAQAAAERQLAGATAAFDAARPPLLAARQNLADARQRLAEVRPRTKANLTRAQNAVTAAENLHTLRQTRAGKVATALTAARRAAAAATAAANTAATTVGATAAAVVATQRRIAALQTPAQLAAQAAAVSHSVVASVRPVFTTADTTLVYGTTVHRSVAYAYKRMVDDAARAGIQISAGGFRTKQRQIELRRINGCPDIWTAPASSCRVPTAIPGRSLHEIALAVDVTSGGRSLTSTSPAFKWLKLYAHRYGFVNLPSEPWHWSITGG
ncbi:M15 family metallopeptidase [Spirilliplanes yamanashiensis]|uniref:D-alanyl-D-alanine carboxypeptidase-like core domain-containing protein n=1 Tax=Spirilliplanes yamanashiensis TaxID=42233 RepID=A0A8J3Y599_9ACTN|nr:M15 family metallopeptidase [Spirilliplanes yamanashiensis]MDP9819401.1 D-alanyl-D-alanine carboxypeptidase [Spirilliplanes yamanashiensis]GIJ01775.1 hypothetical protein Sya03_11270 [Spirilliplanes yamanashiensis]